MVYYYELTIRKTLNPVWIVDYEDFFKSFKKKFPHASIEYAYEPERGLHAHCLVTSPKKVYIDKFHPGRGWNLEHTYVRNNYAWIKYMKKQAPLQTDLINREYDAYNEFLNWQAESAQLHAPEHAEDPTCIDESISPNALIKTGFDIRKLKSAVYIVEPRR